MAYDPYASVASILAQFDIRLTAAEAGATPTPTPAPTFTTQPSVSPSSGTAGTTTFTATPGTVSNGSVSSRAWLLNGTSIITGLTAAPSAAGTLTYHETATGAGGTTLSAVQSVTVAAAGGALAITGSPGQARQGSAYSFTPNVTGGSGTKTFAYTGTLPGGLSFSTVTGAISGTPTSTGTFSGISITVSDTSGSATLSNLSIVVAVVSQLTAFVNAINAARTAGTGMIPVVHFGDSTTHGYGAGTSSTARTGAVRFAYPYILANLLNTGALSDFRQSTDCIMGCSDEASATYPAYDPRVVFGAGWLAASLTSPTLGGGLFSCPGTATTNLAFTPEQDFDTIDVLYATDTAASPVNGIGEVRIGSGALLGTFDCQATSSVKRLRLTNVHGTGAAALGTINIRNTGATGFIYITGIIAYNSGVKTIMHINAGWGGSTAAQNAGGTRGYAPRFALGFVEPKLTILNFGINDKRQAVTTTAFKGSMQTLITIALNTGSAAIISPWATATSLTDQATQDAYVTAYNDLVTTNNIPLYDLYARYGLYTAWNPTYGFNDSLHPRQAGYADEAGYLKTTLLGQI